VTLQLAPIVFKAADLAETGRFRGLASSYSGQPDRHGDVLERGAYRATLADWRARGGRVPLLWNHDPSEPIGAVVTADETDAGLEIEGELSLTANPTAERAYGLLKTGALSLSIGAAVAPGGAVLRADGVRVLKSLELREISAVAVPADPGAVIRVVKSLDSPAEWQDVLRSAGLSKRQSERFISGGLRAALKQSDTDEAGDMLAELAKLNSIIRGMHHD
jgi:HK97 family phage prohead protease